MTVTLTKSSVAEQKKLLTRRRFLLGSAVAAGGLALYSSEIARHEISITTQNLAINNLPSAFENFRIAQISDIHFDEYTEPYFVRRIVQRVNALKPDLVLITGDFISFAPLPRSFVLRAMEHCAQILNEIECPQRYASMGNHDSFLGAPTIRPILANVRIPLLVNSHIALERQGQNLWLGATHDPVTHVPDLDTTIPSRPDGPVLLMCHAPDYADTVVRHPKGHLVDAMFSGHTHGGQIRLPLLPPLHLPTGGKKYAEGLFRFGQMQLYVNRGIGAVGLPFRLNCPPEITLFTLRNA